MPQKDPQSTPDIVSAMEDLDPTHEITAIIEFQDEESPELHRLRADVRNSFRPWFERIEFLARWFDKPHIQTIGPDDIRTEEQKRLQNQAMTIIYRCRQIFGANRDGDPGLEAILTGFQSREYVMTEEYVRYLVKKLEWYIAADRFEDTNTVFFSGAKHLLKGKYPNSSKEMLSCETIALVKGKLQALYKAGDYKKFVDAFVNLGILASPFRLSDIQKEDSDSPPELENECFEVLARKAEHHPYAYKMLRDGLDEAGLLWGEMADTAPVIEAAINIHLLRALKISPLVYKKVFLGFVNVGFSPEELVELPEIKETMIDKLVKMMRQSPELYFRLKESWSEDDLFDLDDVDEHPRIQDAYRYHLFELMRKSTVLYNRHRFRWSQRGLSLKDQSMMREPYHRLALAEEYIRRRLGNEHADSTLTSQLNQYDGLVEHLVGEDENEQMNALVVASNTYDEQLKRFVRQCPQFKKFLPEEKL